MRRNKAVMAGIKDYSFPKGDPLRGWPKCPASDDEELNVGPPAKKKRDQTYSS
jgi:hypothetical protein